MAQVLRDIRGVPARHQKGGRIGVPELIRDAVVDPDLAMIVIQAILRT